MEIISAEFAYCADFLSNGPDPSTTLIRQGLPRQERIAVRPRGVCIKGTDKAFFPGRLAAA